MGDLDILSIDDMLASVDNDLSEFGKKLEEVKTRQEADTLTKYLTDTGFTKTSKGPASEKFTLIFHKYTDEHIRNSIRETIKTSIMENITDTINNAVIITSDDNDIAFASSKKHNIYSSIIVLVEGRTIKDYYCVSRKKEEAGRKVTIDSKGTIRISFPFELHIRQNVATSRDARNLPLDILAAIPMMISESVSQIHSRHRNLTSTVEGITKELTAKDDYRLMTEEEELEIETEDEDRIDGESLSKYRKRIHAKLEKSQIYIKIYEYEIDMNMFKGSVKRLDLLLDMLIIEGFEISRGTIALARKRVSDMSKWTSPMAINPTKDNLFRTHMGRVEQVNKTHKLELQWHQKYSIAMSMRKKAAVLQCDVGLGKTRISIGLHYALGVKRTLVCVEPGMVGEFIRELNKLKMPSPYIMKKTSDVPDAWKKATPITLLPYSILGTETEERISKKTDPDETERDIKKKPLFGIHTTGDDLRGLFDLVIFDECQNIKDMNSLRTKAAIRLKPRRSLFMSGTVITNKMSELSTYALIGYGGGNAVSKLDIEAPKSMMQKNRRRLVKVEDGYKIIHNMSIANLRVSTIGDKMASDPEFTASYVNNLVIKVSRENEEVVRNDDFRFNVKEMKILAIPCERQFQQYLAILEGSREHTDTEQRSLAKLMAMTKISECPELIDKAWEGEYTEKQIAIRDLIKEKLEEERSILVFTGLTQSAKRIHEMLEAEAIKAFLLTNDMSPTARFKIIEKFRKEPNSVAIGNIGIMGKGFNLENADVVVMSDIPWSPAQYEQAVGRILRPDQKGNPEVYMVFNKFMIDQYKFEVITSKRRTIDKYLKDKEISLDETKHISYSDFLKLVIKKAEERGVAGI